MKNESWKQIENIRYDGLKIAWDYNGQKYTIHDPLDIMLVGESWKESAQKWIWNNYEFLMRLCD